MKERIYLSIIRKKSKTIIFAIVMFVIANLIFSTIAIKNATSESIEYAKETLGAEVTLTADMQKLRENQTNTESEEKTEFKKLEMPSIYLDTVTKIAESTYVKDYTYSVSVNANVVDQDVIESETKEEFKKDDKFGRMNDMFSSMGNIQITAINAYAFIPEVESGSIKLTDGETFNETNTNSIIISNDFALLNELKVGDKIKIENISTEKEYEYTIIGIYESTSEEDSNNLMSSSNKMYMNVESAVNLMSEDNYNKGNYAVTNITFYLTSAEVKDKFIEDANKKVSDLSSQNLILDIDTQAYEQMIGPIESVGSSATTILVVVIIASIVIITLIVNSQIKEKKYEMGVLMSLGESKTGILLQTIIEFVIIATVSFLLSTGTSLLVAKTMGNSILSNQTTMTETQDENNFGRFNGMNNMPNMKNKTTKNVETIDKIDISMSPINYVLLFITGYGIILFSLIIPSINIMKYEPKTILTRREN